MAPKEYVPGATAGVEASFQLQAGLPSGIYVAAFADEGGTDLGMMRYHDRTVGGIAIDSRGSLWASCGELPISRCRYFAPRPRICTRN